MTAILEAVALCVVSGASTGTLTYALLGLTEERAIPDDTLAKAQGHD